MGAGLKRARAAAKATTIKPNPESPLYMKGLRDGEKKGALEMLTACGGCRLCYGKGFSTTHVGGRLRILPCVCSRGTQFNEVTIAIQRRDAEVHTK